jgi:hypothetical protein
LPLDLPDVTIVCIDNVAQDLAIMALSDTLRQITPAQVLFWTDAAGSRKLLSAAILSGAPFEPETTVVRPFTEHGKEAADQPLWYEVPFTRLNHDFDDLGGFAALAPAISTRRGRCAAIAPVTNELAANTKARIAIAPRGAGCLASASQLFGHSDQWATGPRSGAVVGFELAYLDRPELGGEAYQGGGVMGLRRDIGDQGNDRDAAVGAHSQRRATTPSSISTMVRVLSIVIFIAHAGAFGVAPTHHRSVGGVITHCVSH